ncbi:MAG: hypothetical protein IT462_04090 [Planctomycetes bacterium]|nr:hypothetical protein [Planctomycetota bacterium]
MEYEVTVGEKTFTVRFSERDGQLYVTSPRGTFPVKIDTPLRAKIQRVQVNGGPVAFGFHRDKEEDRVVLDGVNYEVAVREAEHAKFTALSARQGVATRFEVKAPMPGMVVSVRVKVGEVVKKNQTLLFLHAMKLENDIRSPRAGKVLDIKVKDGNALEKGALMIVLGPEGV